MGSIPEKFSYGSIVEYLIKRQKTFVHSADSDNEETVSRDFFGVLRGRNSAPFPMGFR